MEKEIEVKFKIDEEDKIKEKLMNLGVSLCEPYKQTTYGFFQLILLREVYFLGLGMKGMISF
ncbi:MAG TPA: hypothetical protein PKU93_01055 [Candidatus Pacearchaeota archaeon]|nr:hypothetical protein [Candidatus Pacearchaeota archaeon]